MKMVRGAVSFHLVILISLWLKSLADFLNDFKPSHLPHILLQMLSSYVCTYNAKSYMLRKRKDIPVSTWG